MSQFVQAQVTEVYVYLSRFLSCIFFLKYMKLPKHVLVWNTRRNEH